MKPYGSIITHQFAISALQQRRLIADIEKAAQPDSRLACQTNGWTSPKMQQQSAKAWPLGYFVKRISDLLAMAAHEPHPVRYWFVCVEQDGHIDWHDHSQADWAGVFYPHTPEKNVGGEIIFASGEVIQPKAGLFVAFPGHLRHKVMPYKGSTARYSIAFNRDTQAST